jgi:hypothetical protein
MPEPAEILGSLARARADHGGMLADRHAANLVEAHLRRRLLSAEALGEDTSHLRAELGDVEEEVGRRGEQSATARTIVRGLLADLHRDRTPEHLIESWPASAPILLLPLRVETRWRASELLVRVFPDEVMIDTHETVLTYAEHDAAKGYWQAVAVATTETERKEAWRAIDDIAGAPRAAYAVRVMKPANWDDLATIGPAGLTFPVPGVLKDDRWSEAPRVKVLPDQLVLSLLRGGAVIHRREGALIDDIVYAGPAPLTSGGEASWARDATGAIVMDDDSRWLADFATAVDAGLGFRVELAQGDEVGFDELIVLGVKHSADLTTSTTLLGDLLLGHHHSPKGMAVVPQGTATNNTSGEDAGYNSVDWFADASYAAQSGPSIPEPDLDRATDGERLAAYLGLPLDHLRGVLNADRRDHVEAVAMNAALYSGTLGYFLRTMIGEVASDETLAELRDFCVRFVSGRGPLPAIRVGTQPYGFVLAGRPPRIPDAERRPSLDEVVEGLIAKTRHVWMQFVPGLARIGGSANASADLLAVLGLQPSSAEYFQRIATTYDHLANLAGFANGDRFDEVFEAAFAGMAADNLITNLGYRSTRPEGSSKPYPLLFQLIFANHQTKIPIPSLIDGTPFSEERTIKAYDASGTHNYIDWLAAHMRDAASLREQDFSGAPRPTFLLYMLMRHALLIESATSVVRLLRLFDIEAPELATSRKFLGMTKVVDVAAWEILSAPANRIEPSVASDRPLLSMVHLPQYRIGAFWQVGVHLGEMEAAYGVLRGLPTARLERLFAEHLDTLSYRLDAWETALIDRRLRRRLEQKEEGSGGVFLGAVGYLERVRPQPGRRKAIEEDRLPTALRTGAGDLYRPVNGGGFIHTPSLNHATAAAILRNGFLTHATPADREPMAVDLSSRRVRRAQHLMEGVRNGQPMEALIGIEFERALHEATTRPSNPVVLNDLKPAFRSAFPIMRTRIPKAGHPGDAPEIVPDFSVANGLSIAASADTFPVGVDGIPALDGGKIAELRRIQRQLRDSIDALKDVVTTEAAYQLALGNFDRSAAIVHAAAGTLAPPEIEATRSSRGTDLAFTQRVTIAFDPATSTNPWAPISMTPRATIEPALNDWIGSLFDAPAGYACRVEVDDAGTTSVERVTLAELGLQPGDLIRIVRGLGAEGGSTELEARVATVAATTAGIASPSAVTISFTDPGPGPSVATFAEAIASLDLVGQIIAAARPLDGRDVTVVTKAAAGVDPAGIDLVELAGRVDAARTSLDKIRANLALAIPVAEAAGATPADVAALRPILRSAADAGTPYSFPTGEDGLVNQAHSVLTVLEGAIAAADGLIAAAGDVTVGQAERASRWIEAARALLGPDLVVMPRYTNANEADIAASHADAAAILAHARSGDPTIDPVSEMIASVANVRPAIHRLHRLLVLGELTASTPPQVEAIQLPHRANDVWLGSSLPAGHEVTHDTLSLVSVHAQPRVPTGPQAGLLVDSWIESFPREEEVTGLAFSFDQPNSAPLQALLLAVAADDSEHWTWTELTDVVRDTILRARIRAVEPDMLDTVSGVTTLVPATVAEFSTSEGALSLDFGLAVPAILAAALEMGYVGALVAEGTP